MPDIDPAIREALSSTYELLELISTCHRTVVYKARHKLVDKIVAIKIPAPERSADVESVLRTRLEALALSRCDHASVTRVKDLTIASTAQCLVMDYVDGATLVNIISEHGPLDPTRFVKLFLQICPAMDHVHKNGIVHRDLKPEHVMISRGSNQSETPIIIGFSLCKMIDKASAMKLDKKASPIGTPNYISPEQCRGDNVDERSDIYSLGCTMYTALTGQPPFSKDSTFETISNHLNQSAPELASFNRELDQFQLLIDKCLAKRPDDRYQNMMELAAALSKTNPAAISANKPREKQNLLSSLSRLWPGKH